MSDELVGVGDWGCVSRLVSELSDLQLGFSLSSAEASEIMKSIGEAIQYLHSINIAHRDVKVTPAYINPMLPDCLVCQRRMGLQPSLWLVGLGTGDHKLGSEAQFGCTQPVAARQHLTVPHMDF